MNQDSTADAAHRLAERLRAYAAAVSPGARMPSTRALVAEHGVSPVTVQKALSMLQAQGVVESRPGVGTFARPPRHARPLDHSWQSSALGPRMADIGAPSALAQPGSEGIALHAGYPDRGLLPERLVRAALGRAARGDVAVSRTPMEGLPELRSWFATELGESSAGATPPGTADVLLTPGSQSGLGSVFRAVAADRPLLFESPTYWGALLAAQRVRTSPVPVASGPKGPDPDELARALDDTGARAFYAQPRFAHPHGSLWPQDVRERVLEVLRSRHAFLIEDDWARDFGIDAPERPPMASLDDSGHVIYIRSLTKSVSPALRVAAVIARGPIRERLLADLGAESLYVSGVLQAAALDVVTDPGWRRHLRGLARQLAERRDQLAACIGAHAPAAHLTSLPRGGLNLWLQLPDGVRSADVVAACARQGLLVGDGGECFPAEAPAGFIRLNYAGPHVAQYAVAARILGQSIAECC